MPSFERRNFNPPRAALGALILLPLLNWAGLRLAPRPLPSPAGLRPAPGQAVETAGFMTLGMRRLAADLAFIRLLMYYGTPEAGVPENVLESGGGRYPEFKDRSLRILDLDPYFTYAALYCAGSLAFNLGRPEEALAVLGRAARFEPREWKYRAYAAAIGFQAKGDPRGVLQELMPVLSEPDCPTQLKSMLAFLNRRLGRREEAIRIYKDILVSRDPAYVDIARDALRQMGAPTEHHREEAPPPKAVGARPAQP